MTGKSAKNGGKKTLAEADERVAEAENKAAENLALAIRIQADFDN